jgi:hypothetical protein
MHVGQVQVEQDDVVIIQLAVVQTLFAEAAPKMTGQFLTLM